MPRIRQRSRNTLKAILIFLASAIFFCLAYIGYKKQHIDLSTLDRLTGIVEERGTDYADSKAKPLVFFVKFRNVDQTLGVYRKDESYADLIERVSPGDALTAYFVGTKSGKINIDLVQLERNGFVILKKEAYEKKYHFLMYLGVVVGILFVALACLQYKQR